MQIKINFQKETILNIKTYTQPQATYFGFLVVSRKPYSIIILFPIHTGIVSYVKSMFYIEGRELMALRRSVNLYVEPIDINGCFNK